MNTKLKNCEQAINALVDEFCECYELQFEGWVGNEIGGVFLASDLFLNVNNVMDCFRYGMPKDKFFEWYDQWIKPDDNAVRLNIKNFVLWK